MVVFVTFVMEYGALAQSQIAVGKAFRDEKLTVAIPGEFHAKVPQVSWRSLANVHHNIEHAALHTTHKFGLGVGRTLEMQAPEHSPAGFAFIILDKAKRMSEIRKSKFPVEIPLRKGLYKITAFIPVHNRLEDEHSFQSCLQNFHTSSKDSKKSVLDENILQHKEHGQHPHCRGNLLEFSRAGIDKHVGYHTEKNTI